MRDLHAVEEGSSALVIVWEIIIIKYNLILLLDNLILLLDNVIIQTATKSILGIEYFKNVNYSTDYNLQNFETDLKYIGNIKNVVNFHSFEFFQHQLVFCAVFSTNHNEIYTGRELIHYKYLTFSGIVTQAMLQTFLFIILIFCI